MHELSTEPAGYSVGLPEFEHWDIGHYTEPMSRYPETVLGAKDDRLFAIIRRALDQPNLAGELEDEIQSAYLQSSLPQNLHRLFFVYYSPGQPRLIISRLLDANEWNFARLFLRLVARLADRNQSSSGYLLEIECQEVPSTPVDIHGLSTRATGPRHFELGLDGLELRGRAGSVRYFLPTDAVKNGLTRLGDVRSALSESYGSDLKGGIKVLRFRTKSYLVTSQDHAVMYRGVPCLDFDPLDRVADIVRALSSEPAPDAPLEPYALEFRSQHAPGGPEQAYMQAVRSALRVRALFLAEGQDPSGQSKSATCKLDFPKHGVLSPYSTGAIGVTLAVASDFGPAVTDQWSVGVRESTESCISGLEQQLAAGDYLEAMRSFARRREPKPSGLLPYACLEQGLHGAAAALSEITTEDRQALADRIGQCAMQMKDECSMIHSERSNRVYAHPWLVQAIARLQSHGVLVNEQVSEFLRLRTHSLLEQVYRVTEAPYPDFAGGFSRRYGGYSAMTVYAALELAVLTRWSREADNGRPVSSGPIDLCLWQLLMRTCRPEYVPAWTGERRQEGMLKETPFSTVTSVLGTAALVELCAIQLFRPVEGVR